MGTEYSPVGGQQLGSERESVAKSCFGLVN